MILHDLHCPGCDHERFDVEIYNGVFPACTRCGTRMRFTPRGFATDVRGSEQVSVNLCEPDSMEPLRWTSSKERDAKMAKQGLAPAGDRCHGALGNSDPMKGRIYSSGKLGGKPARKARNV